MESQVRKLVTLAGNLLSHSQEAYHSAEGLTQHHSNLENTSTSLITLHRQLVSDSHKVSSASPTVAEAQLQHLVSESIQIANELLDTIRSLKSTKENKRWDSIRNAIAARWKQKDIADLQTRLGDIRQQLDTTLLICLREQLNDSEKNAREHYQHTRQHSDVSSHFMKEIRTQHQELLESVRKNRRNTPEIQVKQFAIQLESTAELSLESQFSKLILAHLEYAEIQDRYQRICEAHRTTFEWIFKEPEGHHARWDNFPQWLSGSTDDAEQTGQNLYFITGKAGSGKSTLMKFIFDDDRTLQNLRAWAGSDSLLIAGFFFWNSGVEVQTSGVGLLRTLLYQILRQKPHLVRQVFCKRWESYQAVRTGLHEWDWSDLREAFEILVQIDGLRIALFIDGLDEFDGDHEELADFLKRLSGPTVKICVASRPWLVFEDAFESEPNLLLEQLTRKDIRTFVNDAFTANKHFAKLQRVNEPEAFNLIESLVHKASGVFLWVHLVVKSLLQGLANADRISDLKRRLDDLPADLEDLFDKLLRSLEPFYFSHASQLIRLLKAAPVPPTPLEMSYADEEEISVALEAEIRPWTCDEVTELSESIRRRLNSRCKGLIGVSQYGNSNLERVEFLHRTVKDFVQKPAVWASILKATPEEFDPTQCWANSILMELKTSDAETLMPSDMFRLIQWGIQHAEQSENATRGWQTDYLDELDRTIKTLIVANSDLRTWAVPEYFSSGTCFLDLVLQHGMVFYVLAKLQDPLFAISEDDLEILSDSIQSSASPLSEELTNLIQERVKKPEKTLSNATTLSDDTIAPVQKVEVKQADHIPTADGSKRRSLGSRIATKMEGFWSF